MDRLDLCASILNTNTDAYSILDVGCRGKELKRRLNNIDQYTGIDLSEGDPEVVSHDLEKPLPFGPNEFDHSSALDVVEHIENAQQLIKELTRVSKKSVIISLPNMYHWQFRIKYLLGKELSGKYSFYPHGSKDRHRWLTSYKNSVKFVTENAFEYGINIIPIIKERKKTKPLEWLDFLGSKVFPNLFSWGALFIIKKEPD